MRPKFSALDFANVLAVRTSRRASNAKLLCIWPTPQKWGLRSRQWPLRTGSGAPTSSQSYRSELMVTGKHHWVTSRQPAHCLPSHRLPCSFITSEVVDLTCQCLLAQAEQGEKTGLDLKQIESLVLEEFGRVLTQIIDCSAKNRT